MNRRDIATKLVYLSQGYDFVDRDYGSLSDANSDDAVLEWACSSELIYPLLSCGDTTLFQFYIVLTNHKISSCTGPLIHVYERKGTPVYRLNPMKEESTSIVITCTE